MRSCDVCGHAARHSPVYGCEMLVGTGTVECFDLEPCMCIARRDYFSIGSIREWFKGFGIELKNRLRRALYGERLFDEELPF